MIILRNCQGVERKVEEGVVYYPQDSCEKIPVGSDHVNLHDELTEELEAQGVQWGDAVAWVTHRLGISQCAPCKARQEILNKAGTLGVKETVRQIALTFRKKD